MWGLGIRDAGRVEVEKHACLVLRFHWLDSMFRDPGSGVRGWASGSGYPGFGFRDPNIRVLGFGIRVSGFRVSGSRYPGVGFRGSGFRVLGFGIRVSGFGVSGSGYQFLGSGYRVSGPLRRSRRKSCSQPIQQPCTGSNTWFRVWGFGFMVSGF